MSAYKNFRLHQTNSSGDNESHSDPSKLEDKKFDEIMSQLSSLISEYSDKSGNDRDKTKHCENLKHQLASLAFTKSHKQTALHRASLEIAEVLHEVENSTKKVLSNSEIIEQLVDDLRLRADTDDQAALQSLSERITEIYESCYFQDTVSQRLNKVLNMLTFMEKTVDEMSTPWGGLEALKDCAPANNQNEHYKLLEGPALSQLNNTNTQAAIDDMFN